MPVKRKKRTKKGACGYHSCKEKVELTKCKYCKKLYCQVHINPLMPGTEEWQAGKGGHTCPQAYEEAAREAVAKKKDEISTLQSTLEKPAEKGVAEEVAIEADWVIDINTDDDVKVVKETMLAEREQYRGMLVNISPKLDVEKRNKIIEELNGFAKENNWKVTAYSDAKIHFAPSKDVESGKHGLWDKFVNWLQG